MGRGYAENGAPPSAGYRNGYRRGRLATAEGPIEYGVPQVADRAEPFASRVRAGLARRTAELERLAVEMLARGLSTRDIDEAFAGRDLSEFSVACLFVDGDGQKVLLHLAPGTKEDTASCTAFFEDLKRRVLRAVVQCFSDDFDASRSGADGRRSFRTRSASARC